MSTYIGRPREKRENKNKKKKKKEERKEGKKIYRINAGTFNNVYMAHWSCLDLPQPYLRIKSSVFMYIILSHHTKIVSPTSSFLLMIFMYT